MSYRPSGELRRHAERTIELQRASGETIRYSVDVERDSTLDRINRHLPDSWVLHHPGRFRNYLRRVWWQVCDFVVVVRGGDPS